MNNHTPFRQNIRDNKYDTAINSICKPNERFLNKKNNLTSNDRIENIKKAVPYYPLPSNEGYEKFLRVMKKDQYNKTQYSIPFLLSLKKKYVDRPANMLEIKIPLKYEIRSRAKILTDEAFRETRNYLDVHTDVKNPQSRDFLNNLYKKIAVKSKEKAKPQENAGDEVSIKTSELRELLNKISIDNYETYLDQILKFNYTDVLLENFKNLIFAKAVTEKNYKDLYLSICYQMFKLYNKRVYPNDPQMNFKSLLLKKCQEEFYDTEQTSITFPFAMDEEERLARFREIKLGNIRLIGDLFLHNTISLKIISECFEFLLKKIDEMNMRTLCELIKIISKKLSFEDLGLLENAINVLDDIYNNEKSVSTKTKFLILDVLELKKEDYNNKQGDQLKEDFITEIRSRKNSEIPSRSRKSSINPSNVEYIKRSRFNSMADELKVTKEENPGLMEELVTSLGADIEFYQCFRLTEEEYATIKTTCKTFLIALSQDSVNLEEITEILSKMLENLQCEKFIAVGHLLEIMFSLNVNDSTMIMNLIIYLHGNKLIDEEDIKHGIVLGLVNFKDNIIDYPNSKDYLQKFLKMINDKMIIDEKVLKVYQRCCDNMEKCYD